jgi:hypothetical protein
MFERTLRQSLRSVLRMRPGWRTTICGGEIRNVDLAGLPDAVIEGGTFFNIGVVVRVFGAESVIIQGGSFDTTGQGRPGVGARSDRLHTGRKPLWLRVQLRFRC